MLWSPSALSALFACAAAGELLHRGRPVVGGSAGVGPRALSHAVVGRAALWRRRAIDRAELARSSRAELRDIRLSPGDAWNEARKPFWRG